MPESGRACLVFTIFARQRNGLSLRGRPGLVVRIRQLLEQNGRKILEAVGSGLAAWLARQTPGVVPYQCPTLPKGLLFNEHPESTVQIRQLLGDLLYVPNSLENGTDFP